MAKKVRKIPATLNQFTSEPVAVKRKKKVAGYARVSTDREEQATSYEAQMTYYKTYIEGHEDWEFVGMYSDEGITATNTKKRDGFNQMVEDALDGKIDQGGQPICTKHGGQLDHYSKAEGKRHRGLFREREHLDAGCQG